MQRRLMASSSPVSFAGGGDRDRDAMVEEP
jgi:hypothetical protein